MNLELFSQKIYNKVHKNTEIDPQTIILIITVVIKLIEMYKECQKNPKEIHHDINRSLVRRLPIRKILRNVLPHDEYISNKKEYVDSIIECSKELSLNDVEGLVLESELKK